MSRLKRLTFAQALEEIGRLPPLDRRLLCKAALIWFSSMAGHKRIAELSMLPENHPERLVAQQRMGHDVILLLDYGEVPRSVVESATQNDHIAKGQ